MKRRSQKKTIFFLLLVIIVALCFFYFSRFNRHWIYDFISGDSSTHLEDKITLWEKNFIKKDITNNINEKEGFLILLDSLSPIHQLANFVLERYGDKAASYHNKGLLYFYTLLLCLHLDQKSLILAAGRGYLPRFTNRECLRRGDEEKISQNILEYLHIAEAVNPKYKKSSVVQLAFAYGALFLHGRTDERDLERLVSIQAKKLPYFLWSYYEWISIVFYTIHPKSPGSLDILEEIKKNQAKNLPPRTGDRALENVKILEGNSLYFNQDHLDLLQSYSLFKNKKYREAILSVRHIPKPSINEESLWYIEKLRLETEIFAIQLGNEAAKKYLLKILNTDIRIDPLTRNYILERLESFSKKTTKTRSKN